MTISAKNNIILGNYIENYISTQIFIEIKWPVDFRKDPAHLLNSRELLFFIFNSVLFLDLIILKAVTASDLKQRQFLTIVHVTVFQGH